MFDQPKIKISKEYMFAGRSRYATCNLDATCNCTYLHGICFGQTKGELYVRLVKM